MKFRPCIDLHQGVVKQIVGSTLSDNDAPKVNFTGDKPVSWHAELYRKDNLTGGHVIRLGPGNDQAALEALSHWPGGFKLGGGIHPGNAIKWLEAGAQGVIVTSYIFKDGKLSEKRLKKIAELTGGDRLTLDLSCREKNGKYIIATDRWQKLADFEVTRENLDYLSRYCGEFLIHGIDAEGRSGGVNEGLIRLLGNWGKAPVTYAGGVGSPKDIKLIHSLGQNKIDFTVGSALDIFGGKGLKYTELARNLWQYIE